MNKKDAKEPLLAHPWEPGDIWGLDDGAWVAIGSIRVECEGGEWFVAFAEDKFGNELSASDCDQLRHNNHDKFMDLCWAVVESESEARAIAADG